MEEERYNKIIDISFKFGVRIVKLFQYLVDNNVNYAIPNQILKAEQALGPMSTKASSHKVRRIL
jgi:hypothetical protein